MFPDIRPGRVSAPVFFAIDIPEPPSANAYWRTVNGRPILSREARAYKHAVAQLLQIEARDWEPLAGDVAIDITWYRGARRGDLDNRLKVALDALKGILFVDDKQVTSIKAVRVERPGRPAMLVQVDGVR